MAAVIRFLYYVSIVLFGSCLFFSYYQFPDYVAIGYEDSSQYLKKYYSKSILFYVGSAVFLIFNVLGQLLKAKVSSFPLQLTTSSLFKFWRQDYDHINAFKDLSVAWINSFLFWVNIFLSSVYGFLFLANVLEVVSLNHFIFLYYVFIPILLFWWLVWFVRLRIHKLYL